MTELEQFSITCDQNTSVKPAPCRGTGQAPAGIHLPETKMDSRQSLRDFGNDADSICLVKALNFTRHPLIMGILNVTPDSFSGDGLLTQKDYVAAATAQAERMLDEGADILDIGGESSRPGATLISAEEEIRRIVPVVEAIRQKRGDTAMIAIDTVKARVADAALQAGATIINDISALDGDPAMAAVIARHGCPVVLMHNRSHAEAVTQEARIGGQYSASSYSAIVEDVKRDLMASVGKARIAGIAGDKIILDPGLGFGKSVAQNLALLKHIGDIKELGFPVLIGPSRKSFIGKTLDLPVNERLEGTAATVALSAFLGADIIRVHDVKFMARAAKMAAAIRDS
jgi:dihydropteroate synthase